MYEPEGTTWGGAIPSQVVPFGYKDDIIYTRTSTEKYMDKVIVMTIENLQTILKIGETVAVEFKRCGNGIENDTYESVCSFLNRFGGDIFLGF